jgi:8-oxo-dGTP diphosphatase
VSDDLIRAAGAVLWRPHGDDVEVLLVHRPKYDDWSLPKGKLDDDEHVVAAAVREVREETGQWVRLGAPLATQHYAVDGRPKEVRYWAAEVRDASAFAPTHEIDRLAWLPADEACRQLTHPRDAELVRAVLSEALRTWAMILLRHAEAVDRDAWRGQDKERPLTPAGLAQARRLPALLQSYGIERVVSSDAKRCVDTVQPYSLLSGRPVEVQPLFSEEGYDPGPAAAAGRELRDSAVPVVVCSHRPVLPDVAAVLCEGSEVSPPRHELDPGAFWVVHLAADVAVALEAHAP